MNCFSDCCRPKASEDKPDDYPPCVRRPKLPYRGTKRIRGCSSSLNWKPELEPIMEDGVGSPLLEQKSGERPKKKWRGFGSMAKDQRPRNSSIHLSMYMMSASSHMF